MQSTLHLKRPAGLHAGIIMDGNGRWAQASGRSRTRGHVQGARVARAVVEGSPALGIGVLTLYAFSSDNWKRPAAEVRSLMRLLRVYLRSEAERCIENGIRIEVIGRRDRLTPIVAREIAAAEGLTARGDRLLLRLAIDYSGRNAILAAALAGPTTRREFAWNLDRASHARTPVSEVDLLLRTGGERRLSDFMLWESAYAELVFTDTPWPAFTVDDLASAVQEFRGRERRFGGSPSPSHARAARTPPNPANRPAAGDGSRPLSGIVIAHAPRR